MTVVLELCFGNFDVKMSDPIASPLELSLMDAGVEELGQLLSNQSSSVGRQLFSPVKGGGVTVLSTHGGWTIDGDG